MNDDEYKGAPNEPFPLLGFYAIAIPALIIFFAVFSGDRIQ